MAHLLLSLSSRCSVCKRRLAGRLWERCRICRRPLCKSIASNEQFQVKLKAKLHYEERKRVAERLGESLPAKQCAEVHRQGHTKEGNKV